jgi:hypothetical protein
MNPNKKQNKKSRGRINSEGFFEALRGLGNDVVDSAIHDFAEGVTKSVVDQVSGKPEEVSGNLTPNESVNLGKITSIREKKVKKELRYQFNQEFVDLQRQEKILFTRHEQEVKLQIKSIQEELQKLAESTKDLAEEVKIATMQASVEPGIYHLTFLENLRQAIKLFRKRIEESKTWLSLANQRTKKRCYYWAQFKKSGTKFMLSQERYMATSAG